MLNISVSGFYEWRHCDKAHRFGIVETDDFIVQTLKAIIKNRCGGHIPGVLVCYHYLREQGLSIDLKRLRRLMREHGLFHRFHRKYIQTTDSEHDLVRSPNLLQRHFDDFGINEAWCGDITYIPTNEGWLYLASVIDLGTRRLVGYSFGARMDKRLVMDALSKAFRHERPRAGCLFHSDQGSQYCSQAFQQQLHNYQMISSMSRRGQCWDNAPADTFWATLKRETFPANGCFESRAEAQRQVRDWLLYYNGLRPHSKLQMKSPNEYYAQLLTAS